MAGDANYNFSRRRIVQSAVGSGLLFSIGSGNTTAQQREGDDRSSETAPATTQNATALADAVVTPEFSEALVDTSYTGVAEQAQVFEQELQGFPVPLDGDDDSTATDDGFTLISSGLAEDAPNDPEVFASTDVGGPSISNYSPDNYDANNVATLSFDFVVPQGTEGIAFDWKFGTEENPEFLSSQFQDFFEAILIGPDGTFRNIALLPDETPVTVRNADNYSNSPGGSSQQPEPPLPDPPDVAYNAVTDLQTAVADVSAFEGQTVRLRMRIADASDGVFDSAAFLDNLRFLGDVDIDVSVTPAVEAMSSYQQAVNDAIQTIVQRQARESAELFGELGEPDDVINYFGIKAGAVNEDEMDEELFEQLDEILQDIPPQRAQEAYEFVSSMYADVETTLDTETLTELFTDQYYTAYPAGDQTIAEFQSDFNDSFDQYQQSIIDQLDSGDYSSGDVDRIASYWNDRRLKAQRVRNKFVGDSERFVEAILEDGEITGHLVAAELDGPDVDGQVQTDAIGVTLVAALLIKKAAAAGVASKAYGAAAGAATTTGGKAIGLGAAAGTAALGKLKAAWAFYKTHHIGFFVLEQTISWLFIKPQPAGGPMLPDETEHFPEDVDETLEIARRDAELLDVSTNDIDILDKLFSGDGLDVGTETADVTLINSGATSFRPDFDVSIRARRLSPAGQSAVTGYPAQVTEDVPELEPGETATVEVEYTVPVGVFTSDYDLIVEIPDQNARLTESFESGLLQLPNITSKKLDEGTMSDGDTVEVTSDVDPDTENITFEMEYSQLNCDLHVYDDGDVDEGAFPSDIDANHVGFNYQTNEYEVEIPGATTSGRDEGVEGEEWISVQGVDEDAFTVQLIAPELETVIQGASAETLTATSTRSSDDGAGAVRAAKQKTVDVDESNPDISYAIDETSVEPAPPTFSTTSLLDLDGDRGEVTETTMSVSEGGSFDSLSDVVATPSELTGEQNDMTISPENVTAADGFSVSAGGSEQLPLSIEVPDGVEPDFYHGELELAANDGEQTTTVGIDLNVEMHPSGVYEGLYDAVDAEDTGDLSREDVRGMIQEYAQTGDVDGIAIGRDDVRRLIHWYAQ